MKTIIFIILSLISTSQVFSREYGDLLKDWKVVVGENNYYIQKFDLETRMYKITSIGGEPKVEKLMKKDESPGIIYVIYYAGSAGTSHIVTSYRAVVFDLKKNKFLGDVAYKYESQQKKKVYQPSWKYEDGKLIVEDESFNTKKVIPLK